jgi:hypothetical protein
MQRAEHMIQSSITLSRAQHHAILGAKNRKKQRVGEIHEWRESTLYRHECAVSLFDPA